MIESPRGSGAEQKRDGWNWNLSYTLGLYGSEVIECQHVSLSER